MATEAAARRFMSAPFFAVVGASSNPAKFGHKIHNWYIAHKMDVVPVNPGAPSVNVGGHDYSTIPNLTALSQPKETSVSIITHPAITIDVLKEAKEVGVPSIWLQPGTFDEPVLDFALKEGQFESVVYGDGGRGSEGWCVLVDGEKALRDAGKL